MATDIVLESSTHDIRITNKDIQLFTTIEDLTVQKVKINLLNFRGEWFRDITTGIPYLQEILGVRNNKDVADTLIKNAILNTDNITSIISYSSSINEDRKLLVLFSAMTNSGTIIDNISVEV